jgi:translin
MKNLQNIISSIEKELDDKDKVREIALTTSRELVRLSKDILGEMNRKSDPRPLLGQIRREAAKLKSQTARFPEIYHAGYVEGALAEVVEICVLYAIQNDQPLPTPKDLSATPESYLLGLGDVIGELRRMAVNDLKETKPELAEGRLSQMEALYELLMRFDYPDAIVPLRRKQDTARALIERTRGEVLVSKSEKALKEKLDRVAGYLERVERGGQRPMQQQANQGGRGQGPNHRHRHR